MTNEQIEKEQLRRSGPRGSGAAARPKFESTSNTPPRPRMLLDWNKAMQKEDFSLFYKNDCAKVWQGQTTPEKLRDTFKQQFDGQKIDFSGAIKEMEPTFEPDPAMSKVGDFHVLTIKGYCDTKPNRFSFELKLVQDNDEWKLVSIGVKAAKPTESE